MNKDAKHVGRFPTMWLTSITSIVSNIMI